jgi:hypothetical protein
MFCTTVRYLQKLEVTHGSSHRANVYKRASVGDYVSGMEDRGTDSRPPHLLHRGEHTSCLTLKIFLANFTTAVIILLQALSNAPLKSLLPAI